MMRTLLHSVTPALALLLAATPALAGAKRVPVGAGVELEIEGSTRRVIVSSTVVLRKGVLEGLLTRVKKKEHEYILAADVDARHIHTALEAAQAKAGTPVQFSPQFSPPERGDDPSQPSLHGGGKDCYGAGPGVDSRRQDAEVPRQRLGLRRQPVWPEP